MTFTVRFWSGSTRTFENHLWRIDPGGVLVVTPMYGRPEHAWAHGSWVEVWPGTKEERP